MVRAEAGMRTRRKPRHIEDQHQRALFQWAEHAQTTAGPLRRFMFAIPNGGKRSKLEAMIMKGLGVTAGVSDIFLMLPAGGCHGKFIELKSPGNKPTAEQANFLDRARMAGYHATWHADWLEARSEIERYLRRGGWISGDGQDG